MTHLPEMISAMANSHELKVIINIIIPLARHKIHRQLALAEYVLVPLQVVPYGNRGNTLSLAEDKE